MLLVVFGSPWIILPIHFHETIGNQAEPDYIPFDPEGTETPRPVSERIRRANADLAPLGFTPRGTFYVADVTFSVYRTVFENQQTHVVALLSLVIPRNGHIVTILGFGTEYADGTELLTTDGPAITLTPTVRKRAGSMAYPQVADARHLHELHQAAAAPYSGDPIRQNPLGEDPAEFLRADTIQEYEGWVKAGYYYLDANRQRYRPTWKGAILITWRLIGPVAAIQRAMLRRRARKRIRELGLDRAIETPTESSGSGSDNEVESDGPTSAAGRCEEIRGPAIVLPIRLSG